jgi:hypothetical protein
MLYRNYEPKTEIGRRSFERVAQVWLHTTQEGAREGKAYCSGAYSLKQPSESGRNHEHFR